MRIAHLCILSRILVVASCLACFATHLNASPLPAGPEHNPHRHSPAERADTAVDGAAQHLVDTPLGRVRGADAGGGGGGAASRFTIPFAQPPVGALRFASPVRIDRFPAGAGGGSQAYYDASRTPPSCMQRVDAARGGNAPSEDCLYTTLYVPGGVRSGEKLATLVWFPGGSFVGGSATNVGLDASTWVSRQRIIVAVVQYRLGVFGWLQTSASASERSGGAPGNAQLAGNQALRDAVEALTQLRRILPSFGGDGSAITIAGHSSGAHLVRALLVLPAARTLFRSAALLSDPSNYGSATQQQANRLGDAAMQSLGCGVADVACARKASAQAVLDASSAAYSQATTLAAGIPSGEPWRPVVGSYLPSSLEKLATQGQRLGKPLLMSNVRDEAGNTVGSIFAPGTVGQTDLTLRGNNVAVPLGVAISMVFDGGRGEAILQSGQYPVNSNVTDGPRDALQAIATDGLWTCATHWLASRMAANGDSVYISESLIGARYPSNQGNDYCEKPGVICHEDDILLVFGSASTPLPDDATRRASTEMQLRLTEFARSGRSRGDWPALRAPTSSPKDGGDFGPLLVYGVDGTARVAAPSSNGKGGGDATVAAESRRCAAVWGSKVKFDWQMYS